MGANLKKPVHSPYLTFLDSLFKGRYNHIINKLQKIGSLK